MTRGRVSATLAPRLAELAATEPSVIVRCQLAATARRLSGGDGLPIVERLLRRGLDRDDPYVPLMLWWAIESKALSDTERLLAFFGDRAAWDDAATRENALRLVRRYAAEGTRAGYDACARLLAAAPANHQAAALAALDLGLAERAVAPGGMGMAGLFASVAAPEKARGTPPVARRFEPLAGAVLDAINAAWRAAPADVPRLRLALRAGVADASSAVLTEVAAPATAPARRRALLGLLAEFGLPEAVPLALGLLQGDSPIEVQAAALDVLAPHGDDRVTAALLESYPTRADRPAGTDRRDPAQPAGVRPGLPRAGRPARDRRGGCAPRATAGGGAARRREARCPGAQALGPDRGRHPGGEAGRDAPLEQRPPRRAG